MYKIIFVVLFFIGPNAWALGGFNIDKFIDPINKRLFALEQINTAIISDIDLSAKNTEFNTNLQNDILNLTRETNQKFEAIDEQFLQNQKNSSAELANYFAKLQENFNNIKQFIRPINKQLSAIEQINTAIISDIDLKLAQEIKRISDTESAKNQKKFAEIKGEIIKELTTELAAEKEDDAEKIKTLVTEQLAAEISKFTNAATPILQALNSMNEKVHALATTTEGITTAFKD